MSPISEEKVATAKALESRDAKAEPPKSRRLKVLDTFLRALEKLARLAPEVMAIEDELAGREQELLARVLELLRPILPRISAPIVLREPWVEGAAAPPNQRRWREDGVVLAKKFQHDRDTDGRTHRFSSTEVFLVARGALVEIEQTASWNEGASRDGVWRIESREIELTKSFARENLRQILVSLLDALRLGLKREHDKKKDLLDRMALVEEASRVLESKAPQVAPPATPAPTPPADDTKQGDVGLPIV